MSVAIAELLNESTVAGMKEKVEETTKAFEAKLNPNSIKMSNHAYERSEERFPELKGRTRDQILSHFRNLLKKATFVGEVVSEEERQRTYMYVRGSASIHVDLSYSIIVTIIKLETRDMQYLPDPVASGLNFVFKQNLKKMFAKEKRLLNRFPMLILETNAEIYPLKLMIAKTKSVKKIASGKARIKELEENLKTNENELITLQDNIRHTARYYACFMI